MALVLAALQEMRGINTKQQTIAYIEKKGWFDLQPEDLESYPTHKYEAKWHTMIAFGRQWCADAGLVNPHQERDMWEISAFGTERLAGVREKFKSGIYDVRRGYLWSPAFKKWLCPDWEPSARDLKRPPNSSDEYEFA